MHEGLLHFRTQYKNQSACAPKQNDRRLDDWFNNEIGRLDKLISKWRKEMCRVNNKTIC